MALKVQTVIIQYLVVLQLLSAAERVLLEAALLAVLGVVQGFLEMLVAQELLGKEIMVAMEVAAHLQVVAVALVLLVEVLEVALAVGLAVMEQHRLFLEHPLTMLAAAEAMEVAAEVQAD
jgi:hypothetical protein